MTNKDIDDMKNKIDGLVENLKIVEDKNHFLSQDNERLQSEIEKYRKAFDNANKERDRQICEYREKIKELRKELEIKDGTEMIELLMKNTEGEAKEHFERHLYGNLKCVLWNEKIYDKDIIAKLEDRHQSDCITISRLQTTIDVLTSRYAKLREQVEL